MEETRRNLADYALDVLPALELIFASIDFDIVAPPREEVVAASRLVTLKDAPDLVAATTAQVDFLVTPKSTCSIALNWRATPVFSFSGR